MYQYKNINQGVIKYNKSYVGERLEEKIQRITSNNEPIKDGAPLIYTERKNGVLPQYDIRTDKWDIAQSAMDLANASKIAKSKGMKKPEEPQQNGEPQQKGE